MQACNILQSIIDIIMENIVKCNSSPADITFSGDKVIQIKLRYGKIKDSNLTTFQSLSLKTNCVVEELASMQGKLFAKLNPAPIRGEEVLKLIQNSFNKNFIQHCLEKLKSSLTVYLTEEELNKYPFSAPESALKIEIIRKVVEHCVQKYFPNTPLFEHIIGVEIPQSKCQLMREIVIVFLLLILFIILIMKIGKEKKGAELPAGMSFMA